jgi:transposase
MTRLILQGTARRWRQLNTEIHVLPSGRQLRSGLAISDCNDGDNPQRLCHKRSFATLSAVAPLNTSSGRQQHCLNRGGNRDVSRALQVIPFVHWRVDPATKIYAIPRMAKGAGNSRFSGVPNATLGERFSSYYSRWRLSEYSIAAT